ncbi:hypothetical protein [Micromonospora sp. IBSANI012]|uniref:hypothetical protein n=1 Tax=Micromonospora sp. IBSANI012 TaxID=3457761 RepID=UPI004058A63A
MTTGARRFRVDEVFDLTARLGLVARGTTLDNTLVGALSSVDELTGARARVIGFPP